MGWRIIQQPNGNYARFSDIVDDFTNMNLTREEALAECKHHPGMGVVEAEAKVACAEQNGDEWWVDALRVIRVLHGATRAEDVERCGTTG